MVITSGILYTVKTMKLPPQRFAVVKGGTRFPIIYEDPILGLNATPQTAEWFNLNFMRAERVYNVERVKFHSGYPTYRTAGSYRTIIRSESTESVVATKHNGTGMSFVVPDALDMDWAEPEGNITFTPPLKIGGDIEFIIADKRERIPADGIMQRLHDIDSKIAPTLDAMIGVDGHRSTGEIRYAPADNSKELAKNITSAVEELLSALTRANIGYDVIAGGGHRFGEALGGHIHFGGMPVNGLTTYLTDKFIGAPLKAMPGGKRYNVSNYGQFLSVRNQPWGMEVRSPPSWMSSPELIEIVCDISFEIMGFYKENLIDRDRSMDDLMPMIASFWPKSFDRMLSYVAVERLDEPINKRFATPVLYGSGYALDGIVLNSKNKRPIIRVYGTADDIVSYYGWADGGTLVKSVFPDAVEKAKPWMSTGVSYIGIPYDMRNAPSKINDLLDKFQRLIA
jgi:hypothetical protein